LGFDMAIGSLKGAERRRCDEKHNVPEAFAAARPNRAASDSSILITASPGVHEKPAPIGTTLPPLLAAESRKKWRAGLG
jgi:hypothetical protein